MKKSVSMKLLSFIIAACIVAAVCPSAAFAATVNEVQQIFLSDTAWASWMNNSGAVPGVDQNLSGGKINVGGKEYDKGISVQPDRDTNAGIHYDLSGMSATAFTAVVGRDASAGAGAAVAYVYADGVKVFESKSLTAGANENVNVNVTGVTDLWLVVNDGGDGNTGDVVAFADAKLDCSDTAAPEKGSVNLSSLASRAVSGTYYSEKLSDGEYLQVNGMKDNLSALALAPTTGNAASASFDIPGIKAESISAWVGFDKNGNASLTGHKATYSFYAGDTKIAESPELGSGEYCLLSAALPSDATTVKLSVSANNGDVCTFGNAKVNFPVADGGFVNALCMKPELVLSDNANPYKITADSIVYSAQTGDSLGKTGEIHYDVSNMDAKNFTASASVGALSADGVIMLVYADGQVVYQSEVIAAGGKADISANVTGSRLVSVVINSVSGNMGDIVTLKNPRFTLDAGKVTHNTDYAAQSLTELKWSSAVSCDKDPQINKPYETGANYPIEVASTKYKYGISVHPYAATSPSTINYDISGLGYERFSVKVGKTREATISNPSQSLTETFLIYGDGVLLAKSEPITYNHFTELNVDVSNVKTLTLACDGNGNITCGACAWCDPMLYYNYGKGDIHLTSETSARKHSIFGSGYLNVSGEGYCVKSVQAKSGENVLGTISALSGTFNYAVDVGKLNLGINSVAFSGNSDTSLCVTVDRTKKISLLDLEWESTTGCQSLIKEQGYSSKCNKLSVGSARFQTLDGFSVVPDLGSNAEIVINLNQLNEKVGYFHSIVGIDDYGAATNGRAVAGDVQYYVLSDAPGLTNSVIGSSKILCPNDFAAISCAVPAGTTKLTLRVSNVNNDNYMDAADWIRPCLYVSADDFGSVDKQLYNENNLGGNVVSESSYSAGVRIAPSVGFSSITMYTDAAADKITGNLYKFTYSYTRSIQNGSLCTVAARKSADGSVVFNLNDVYEAGEYLFVADGVTKIKANGSQYGWYYADGVAHNGLLNMSVLFTHEADSYLNIPTSEPLFTTTSAYATEAEKARAKGIYEGYTKNLETFPCIMTIGGKDYQGFGDSDFTVSNVETETDAAKHCETTTTTIDHVSGLCFSLVTVFYPDYAAFDWVIYFTNKADENSPIVSSITGATLQLEGTDPILLSNYGDWGTFAPYTPQTVELADGDSLYFAPTNGRSCQEAFPYYNYEYGDKGAIIAVSWSGQWQATFDYEDGVTSFDDRQQGFASYVAPGEVARTPLTAMVLYDGRDTDRATNLWRNWFIDCNMNRTDGHTLTDPLIAGVTSAVYNEMCNATEKNQMEAINAYLDNGVDLDVWWMDAGWYPEASTGMWQATGTWTPDLTRFPTAFSELSALAKANDMKTLLWFQPELSGLPLGSFDPNNENQIKKEWLLGASTGNYTDQLDLGNEDCLNFLIKQITQVMVNGGISIYREDLNTGAMATNWIRENNSHPNRTGMSENKCVQGHLKLWESLLDSDSIDLIDTCASGGHRLDLETMRLSVALHPTDYNYNDNTAKQIASYGLASWFPFAGANTGYNTTSVDKYTMRSAYRQALILQFNPNVLKEDEYELLNTCIDEWKSINTYFYNNVYQLTDNTISANSWYSYGYLDDSSQNGYAMVYRRDGDLSPEEQYIKLKGLNAAGTYTITFADSTETYTMSGEELMLKGVKVKLVELNSSEIIYIKCTNNANPSKISFTSLIKNAEKLNLAEYSVGSSLKLITALSFAKAVSENAAATVSQMVSAKTALNEAVNGMKPASDDSGLTKDQYLAEIGNVIGSIGSIDATNYAIREVAVKYAESLKASAIKNYGADVLIPQIEMLDAARAGINSFKQYTVTLGDVNNDNGVDSKDALMILQYAVGKAELTAQQIEAADVDKSGAADSVDALKVLQYTVGKITEF